MAYGCKFLMMTRIITEIEPQKKDPKRVNIYLDGKYAFSLNGILGAWLRIGQDLSDERMNSMISEDEHEKAYQKALHFLSFRPRSIHEVQKNLLGRGIPTQMIDETIQRLRENSLLDDLKFSQEWIRNRMDFRPRSRAALSMELKLKGIPEDVIQTAFEEDVDDEKMAFLAARKVLRKLESLNRLEFRKKLSDHLARRGFSYASINPVVSYLWNDLHTGTDLRESNDHEDLE